MKSLQRATSVIELPSSLWQMEEFNSFNLPSALLQLQRIFDRKILLYWFLIQQHNTTVLVIFILISVFVSHGNKLISVHRTEVRFKPFSVHSQLFREIPVYSVFLFRNKKSGFVKQLFFVNFTINLICKWLCQIECSISGSHM